MKNKYRLSIMIVLIIMLFMYMMNIVGITEETNFAFTFAGQWATEIKIKDIENRKGK